MYRDKRKTHLLLIIVIAVIAVIALSAAFIRDDYKKSDQDSLVSMKRSIEQAALQCYVVEGAYPENLEYLIDRYGLRINTRDYIVIYDAFALNLMPDIRVIKK